MPLWNIWANADGLNLETPIVYYTQLGEQRGEFITSVQFEEPEEVWMLSPEYQRQQELEALRQQEHEKREQALRDLEDLNRVLDLFNWFGTQYFIVLKSALV